MNIRGNEPATGGNSTHIIVQAAQKRRENGVNVNRWAHDGRTIGGNHS